MEGFRAFDQPFYPSGEPKQEKIGDLGEIFRDQKRIDAHFMACFLLKVRFYGARAPTFSAMGCSSRSSVAFGRTPKGERFRGKCRRPAR